MHIGKKLKKAKEKVKKTLSISASEYETDDSSNKNPPRKNGGPSIDESTVTSREDGSDQESDDNTKHNDRKIERRKLFDSDKVANYNVLFRIIEAKDVHGGESRVRVLIDNRSRVTRTVTHAVPKWRQNLLFQMKQTSLEAIAAKKFTIRYCRPTLTGERSLGEFWSYLAEVIHHSEDSAVINKWIALSSGNDGNDEGVFENCGFLNVSICVYRAEDSPPPFPEDEDESETMWSPARISNLVLKVRLFHIQSILGRVVVDHSKKKNKKNKQQFYVVVECGGFKVESTFEQAYDRDDSLKIVLDQALLLPIQWPTVVSHISFSLFSKSKRTRKCIGKAILPMRRLYEPGEKGYLPTFGPSFITFFDMEEKTRLNALFGKQEVNQHEGSKYVGRLFLSIDVDDIPDADFDNNRLDLEHWILKDAARFEGNKDAESEEHQPIQYKVFCSMSSLNLINPQFASDSIEMWVSIGTNGSFYNEVHPGSSTFAAMPNFDGCKYFAMPWGNIRPVAEIDCEFENIEQRFDTSNGLRKMAYMLENVVTEIRKIGTGAVHCVASEGYKAIERLHQFLVNAAYYLNDISLKNPNDLDRGMHNARMLMITDLINKLSVSIDSDKKEEIEPAILRMLLRTKDWIMDIAEDIQLAIPPVVIKMISGGKLIGFAKVPIVDIYQGDCAVHSGQFCGRTRAINIKWPRALQQKDRKEDYVAVLHAKMWFGRRSEESWWCDHVEPAEIRYFVEVFETQKRMFGVGGKWSEDERVKDAESAIVLKDGVSMKGGWSSLGSQDLWRSDVGIMTKHDKVYELEQLKLKGSKTKFEHYGYKDLYGNKITEESLKRIEDEWIQQEWIPDKLRNKGDKNGWVYSANGVFNHDDSMNDTECKEHHQFRRRIIRRTCIKKDDHVVTNLEEFRRNLSGDWEHAKKERGTYHSKEDPGDFVRRRRFVRQVVKNKDNIDCLPMYRAMEYQLVTTKWELRCYILWGKDLLPVVKESANAIVRISFGTHTKQTSEIRNSLNPVWNQTVKFSDILIPGGSRDISCFPPTVSVEMIGVTANSAELKLGKFETSVKIYSKQKRATPTWFPLAFRKGKTRGALLACFELFESDTPVSTIETDKDTKRLPIPAAITPKFEKYNVQFLCWGVRGLRKHNLLSVCRPSIQMTFGDREFVTHTIRDVRKNPNFVEPLVSFYNVPLPSNLTLSPPFVINLYDSRAFNRHPLVGTCIISDLHKYLAKIGQQPTSETNSKMDKLNALISEIKTRLNGVTRFRRLSKDPMLTLDWWSRYYASMSQFHRSPGYLESGMELVKIFRCPLEKANNYANFEDFAQTIKFMKNTKGDFDDPEEREIAGELKCRLWIRKVQEGHELPEPILSFDKPVKCLVRVYLVEANGLLTNGRKGRVDSYVVVKCGKQKQNLKDNYRSENCDPIYGELVEFYLTLPMDKDLTITVMDKRRILSDEVIGSTTIDLENRLLTKWRGTCGLSSQYTIHGELQWRDQKTPLEILRDYCERMDLPVPKVEHRHKKNSTDVDVGITVHSVTFWHSEVLIALKNEEKTMLEQQRQKAGKEGSNSDSGEEEEVEREVRSALESTREKTRGRVITKAAAEKMSAEAVGITDNRMFCRARNMGSAHDVIALYILRRINLVPEHVETRPLYFDKNGKTKKGDLRMFVDIFPLESGIPPPFDISPRKPIHYQLRIAVLDVIGAIPIKRSFAEPTSDLYLRVFVNGVLKAAKTDTHFRVLDGNGHFNWRFLLDFDYNPWEKKIVAYNKNRLFRKATEELVDPIVVIQLWDKNMFKQDRLLGEMELDLINFIEGVGSPADVNVFKRKSDSGRLAKCCSRRGCLCRCTMFCVDTKCLCGRRKIKKKPFPKPPLYAEPEEFMETVNLFEAKNVYGWYPMLTKEYPHSDEDGARKKHDDADKDAKWVMGCVELDMSLVTQQEAEQDPVGKKRNEPNHSPVLEKPERKEIGNSWLVSRIKPCIKYFWHYYGLQMMIWLFIILLIVGMIWSLITSWPLIVSHAIA